MQLKNYEPNSEVFGAQIAKAIVETTAGFTLFLLKEEISESSVIL